MNCYLDLKNWMEELSTKDLRDKQLKSLTLLLKCLKIMENATFLSKDNPKEAQMKEQGKMILEMRELLNSLMKDKGTRLPPDGDGDIDGDSAQNAAV
ncbi:hypothetical protein QN277_011849 [Acacia crassicarpa]|uniref:Wings apart-like protein C-terminal domain-containing protein n=1 Tax=Acacia crassicarpa TaxID=499986 RepID=A0AAE1MZJ5_9FABA|nr:hypothetical protein QN277_011849 [Acacia crassicarpa]